MNTTKGFFVAIDGPSGIGKSSVTAELTSRLAAAGYSVVATKEPTATPLGSLTRFGTDDYHGLTLACLVAADRYQHLEHEIRPALSVGSVVLCDRYVASSHVLQRMDDVSPDFLWQLNAETDKPDLTVILLGDPARSRMRAEKRGLYSRFHRGGQTSGATEAALYRVVAAEREQAGYDVMAYEVGAQTPHEAAGALLTTVLHRMEVRSDPC